VIIGFIIVLDQMTKIWIKSSLDLYEKVDVIKGFFQLKLVTNSGAVWGIFSRTPHEFIPKIITGLSIIALIIVIYFFLKIEASCKWELVALSFIMGGALGNNIDRIYQGFVVDFLEFYVSKYHWPTFNVADFFISSGVILLIISFWRGKCPSFK
jgi:signal peptidase II